MSTKLRYPQSFLSLLLVGFLIVASPLIAGLISNAYSIDRLAERSFTALLQVRAVSQPGSDTSKQQATIETELSQLREQAARAKQQVFWQVLAMVPSAILLVAGFTFLIARPINELDGAIHRLGRGKLSKRIRVDGPHDIARLGEQLDWLRQRLITLEDQKTRFFQHVSHELKTPLTAIAQGTELLSAQSIGPLNAEQMEVARILSQNTRSLERLIQDLLTHSQLQSATQIESTVVLNASAFDLGELAARAAAAHKLALDADDLKLRVEAAAAPMVGDASKLHIVLDNVLSNAIKYSPRGGEISLRVSSRDGEIMVDIEDTGPGVAEADREKVFEPFFRASDTSRSTIKGTGLGLAIAHDYVRLHGGEIEALARDDGARGAHFRITLPIEATSDNRDGDR